jgi:hypothetical protein
LAAGWSKNGLNFESQDFLLLLLLLLMLLLSNSLNSDSKAPNSVDGLLAGEAGPQGKTDLSVFQLTDCCNLFVV